MRFLTGGSWLAGALGSLMTTLGSPLARAHDIALEIDDLRTGVAVIEATLARFDRRPVLSGPPKTPAEQRRALGEAEVEKALGHRERALRILLGRLADPAFRALPEHVDALLLAAEILEGQGELSGAMLLAREALENGRAPDDLAEAGARYFRMARITRRYDDRVELYKLWRARGGLRDSGVEDAGSAPYEAAFALRRAGRFEEARALLAQVPSESPFGSRAAYLVGALFVQEGNLHDAERWFSALMTWTLPELPEGHRQLGIERELRALAALSAARLRYERGDLEGAKAAYDQVPEGSLHRRDACWELAFLESERERRRAALKHLRCVEALGTPGALRTDLALLESALLAHVSRYEDSIATYRALHERLVAEHRLAEAAFARVARPAELLFSAMERTTAALGRTGAPGPATLLGDAWTPEVDLAYRVDREIVDALDATRRLHFEVRKLEAVIRGRGGLDAFELRRESLRRLLREIDHLAGHAGEMELSVRGRHASATFERSDHDHGGDARALQALLAALSRQRAAVADRLLALEAEARARREQALAALAALRAELTSINAEAEALRRAAAEPVNAAARRALDEVLQRLSDASMRAEVGVLDTYWLKKQHRTRQVEALLAEQDEVERQMDEALEELDR